jgi:hypothetical protein
MCPSIGSESTDHDGITGYRFESAMTNDDLCSVAGIPPCSKPTRTWLDTSAAQILNVFTTGRDGTAFA